MWEFVTDRWQIIAYNCYQHVSLVVQSVILATIIAMAIAVFVTTYPRLESIANGISSIGLTLPSFALLGLLLPLFGVGANLAVAIVTFYAIFPILRNAVVGLQGVDASLIESARGMGMGATSTFFRVRLPLAWPVTLAGLRVSTQMSMGVAAIVAYGLGPGLGVYIFTGLAQIGGANALNYALVATIGIIILALILDAILLLIGRLTTSRGIRV